MPPYRLLRRDDPLVVPSGTGIDTFGITASSMGISNSALVYDHSRSSGTGLDTPSTATTPPPTASTSTALFDSSTDVGVPTTVAASSTVKPIALSAVIGACVGAFIFVTAVIIFSFWIYKRYSISLDKSPKSRGHLHRRNVHASAQQRRSHTGVWNRLEDDKWEESYHTREARDSIPADVTPMEKLTMFKKSASIRTAYTHKSTDASNFSFPATYAEFDPGLAISLKASTSGPQPLLKNTDSGLISFAESNATHLSSSVAVPRKMAIPTPPLTVSHPHRWEAAEVVHYPEGQSAEVVNPFEEDENEGGKTIHNPFFSAKDHAPLGSRRRSNSTNTTRSNSRSRPRADSTATVTPSRIKEHVHNSNDDVSPFNKIDTTPELPRLPFIGHAASQSTSTMGDEDKERALRSLVAALEIPEDEVRDRLRIASLQPSIASSISVEMDMTTEFPLPPSTPTTSFTVLNGGSMSGR